MIFCSLLGYSAFVFEYISLMGTPICTTVYCQVRNALYYSSLVILHLLLLLYYYLMVRLFLRVVFSGSLTLGPLTSGFLNRSILGMALSYHAFYDVIFPPIYPLNSGIWPLVLFLATFFSFWLLIINVPSSSVSFMHQVSVTTFALHFPSLSTI